MVWLCCKGGSFTCITETMDPVLVVWEKDERGRISDMFVMRVDVSLCLQQALQNSHPKANSGQVPSTSTAPAVSTPKQTKVEVPKSL